MSRQQELIYQLKSILITASADVVYSRDWWGTLNTLYSAMIKSDLPAHEIAEIYTDCLMTNVKSKIKDAVYWYNKGAPDQNIVWGKGERFWDEFVGYLWLYYAIVDISKFSEKKLFSSKPKYEFDESEMLDALRKYFYAARLRSVRIDQDMENLRSKHNKIKAELKSLPSEPNG